MKTKQETQNGGSPSPSAAGYVKSQTFHMCVDISGVLRWPDNKLKQLFTDDSGKQRGGRYVRDWLKLQLSQGKRVLPMTNPPCEGFSYQTGCPGHDSSSHNAADQV